MRPSRRAELALLLVTLSWGVSFPLLKQGLQYAPPFTFLTGRFLLALVLLSPWLFTRRPAWTSGLLLAFLLSLSHVAQAWGLQFTSPTRSAFITGLSVVMVPMLVPLVTRRRPARAPTVGAILAGVGMALLTNPGAGGINRGDVVTLLCALGYALYIIVLEQTTRGRSYRGVLMVQMLALPVLLAGPAAAETRPVTWGAPVLGLMAGAALITVVSMYLQTRYQRDTTATRAAVIFAAEPVFAAMFSWMWVGETLAPIQWGGGVVILAGILISEFGYSRT